MWPAANDFSTAPVTVFFPAGSSAPLQLCQNIPIINDVLVEMLESFTVTASSNDPNAEFNPGDDVSTVEITDDDSEWLDFSNLCVLIPQNC